MRSCATCKTPDRAEFYPTECDCGAPSVEGQHKEHCGRYFHSVSKYLIRVDRKDLNITKTNLSPYYVQQGWLFMQNGERFYRWKELCRNCMRAMDDAASRKADYLKACKAAKGLDERTYSQMLASQGS